MQHLQGDFTGVRCVDAGAFKWYPKHHRPVKLGHDDTEGAKGAMADHEGHKDHKGFQFKVFTICYVTSFDEVRGCPKRVKDRNRQCSTSHLRSNRSCHACTCNRSMLKVTCDIRISSDIPLCNAVPMLLCRCLHPAKEACKRRWHLQTNADAPESACRASM